MNICMFTNTYLPHVGGVARSVHFFAEDLRKLGHKVLIVAPTFPDTDHRNPDEAWVLRVPALQNFNGSDFSVRIMVPGSIDQEIDDFQPEVIHSHHPFLLGDSAIRAAYRRGLPLVFTHHTLYEQYTHYVSPESPMMKRLAVSLSTEYANLCTRIIAPSESIAALIAKRGVTRPIEVIPTGVDVEEFGQGDGPAFRLKYGIPENAAVIGHLGRLAPEKNMEFLCEAVIRAIRQMGNEPFFLVVGSGSSEQHIKERFREAGLGDRLVRAGKMNSADLVNAYHAMDVFVFSSRSETQGMVVVEAMAAGLPVIALDASGVREVVEDDCNGRLLPSESSPQTFAESITTFFSQPAKAQDWRREARRSAQRFSRAGSALKMAEFYRDLQREQALKEAAADTISFEPLDDLVRLLKTEWDILTEKTSALIQAVRDKTIEE